MLRPAFRVLLALALASLPALTRAEIYRWVDELGITHFATDRDAIPRSYRDDAIAIGELPSRAPAARAIAPAPVAPEAVAPETVAPETQVAPPESAAPALVERERAPEPTASPAPMATPVPAARTAPAPSATQTASPTPETDTPPTGRAAPAVTEPDAVAPATTPDTPTEPALAAPPVFPGPETAPAISPDDPRAGEVAQLEAQIASDREKLRQMISTKRWDSAELASDPQIREIAERLPRLQAQLAALQAEPAP